jgi:hypothetical protein
MSEQIHQLERGLDGGMYILNRQESDSKWLWSKQCSELQLIWTKRQFGTYRQPYKSALRKYVDFYIPNISLEIPVCIINTYILYYTYTDHL